MKRAVPHVLIKAVGDASQAIAEVALVADQTGIIIGLRKADGGQGRILPGSPTQNRASPLALLPNQSSKPVTELGAEPRFE